MEELTKTKSLFKKKNIIFKSCAQWQSKTVGAIRWIPVCKKKSYSTLLCSFSIFFAESLLLMVTINSLVWRKEGVRRKQTMQKIMNRKAKDSNPRISLVKKNRTPPSMSNKESKILINIDYACQHNEFLRRKILNVITIQTIGFIIK